MKLEDYFKDLKSDQEFSQDLNRQHYRFAHQIVPHLVDNSFSELVSSCLNNQAQDLSRKIWDECWATSYPQYNSLIYPTCNSLMASEQIGLIYWVMPAPRVPSEVAYATAIFLKEQTLPSTWLRSYFTLELALTKTAYWVLGEWVNSQHLNHGAFKAELTLTNFLTQVVQVFLTKIHQ